METEFGKKATVLIVDDSPDSIALLSSFLRSNYRVKVALTGEKALEITEGEDPPDLILLDIVMPGMDGYEVCRRLKKNPLTSEIPVIFLTARSDVMDEAKGLELGAEDYITKPPRPPIVMARRRGTTRPATISPVRKTTSRSSRKRYGNSRVSAEYCRTRP